MALLGRSDSHRLSSRPRSVRTVGRAGKTSTAELSVRTAELCQRKLEHPSAYVGTTLSVHRNTPQRTLERSSGYT